MNDQENMQRSTQEHETPESPENETRLEAPEITQEAAAETVGKEAIEALEYINSSDVSLAEEDKALLASLDDSIALPPEHSMTLKSELYVDEGLAQIAQERATVSGTAKKAFRKAAAIAGATLALVGASPDFAAAQPPKETAPVSRLDQETPEAGPENRIMSAHERQIQTMRKAALWGEKETTGFLITADDGTEIAIPPQEKNTTTTTEVPFSEFRDKFAPEKRIRKIEYMHSHPLRSLASPEVDMRSNGEIAIIQGHQELLSPLPPSLTDFVAVAVGEEEFGEYDASTMEHQVVDPTGIWKYKGNKEPGISYAELRRVMNEYRAAKKVLVKKGDAATPEEIEKFKDKKLTIETFMGSNKEFSKVDETQTKLFEMNGSPNAEKKKALIQEYIDDCKNAGIEMTYQPFEK